VFVGVLALLFVVIFTPIFLVRKDKDDKHNQHCILPEVVDNPPAPKPERVNIINVPMPPTAPSNDTGYTPF